MNIDNKTRNAVIVIAIFSAVILIGQSMIYVSSPYHCNVTIEKHDSKIDVHIDTNYSLEYTINSLKTDSMSHIDSYAIYYDESCPVKGDKSVVLDAIKRLQLCFSNDNTSIPIIDNVTLQKIISNKQTNTAILFMTGILPEVIYNGTSSSPIFSWLSDGGVMYWLHGKIGASYAKADGSIVPVDCNRSDNLFFGHTDVINKATDHVYTKNLIENSLTYKIGVYYGETTNGVNCSHLISPHLALDYNDGEFSAVTLIKYYDGDGIIGVFGGELKYEAVPTSAMASVAQTVVSKLSYDTILIDYTTGSGSKTITMNTEDGYSYVFMYFDRVNAIWAKTLATN